MLKRMHEPVSGLLHLFAGFVSIGSSILLLIIARNDIIKQLSLLIYGLGLVLMFFSSSLYHLIQTKFEGVQILRKLDHAAIYLLIAGTYTPFCLNQFTGFWKWGMLTVIWSLALLGIMVKMFTIDAPRWLSTVLYLFMGWLSLPMLKEMFLVLPVGALIYLFVGGMFFTIGALIYTTDALDFAPGRFGSHEVWHIFVILGCASHYIAVLRYIALVPRLS